MWTMLTLIFAGVTVAVSALCMVSSTSKSKEKKGMSAEENEERTDSEGLSENGVKLASRSIETNTKSDQVKLTGVRIVGLNFTETFNNLTPTERLFAHYSARACFEGALIVFLQISPDSAALFIVLYRVFWFDSVETLREKAETLDFTEPEWESFLLWSASALTIRGIRSMPLISNVRLWKLIASSTAAGISPDLIWMYESIEKSIYSPPKLNAPGFPADVGKNDAITKRDYDICNNILMKKQLVRSNCRFIKENSDGETMLKIKVASTNTDSCVETIGGLKVQIENGDYAKILESVCTHLYKAAELSANNYQKLMLSQIAEHLKKGELTTLAVAHALWLMDKNPIIRSKYYFNENSRGLPGSRSEFSSFVAVVNKKASEKCTLLVEKSIQILNKLPWGKDYEKDTYVQPDFAVLDFIAFAMPDYLKGHNFANEVTMGRAHVFSNMMAVEPLSTLFLAADDQKLLRKYDRIASEVFTGLHELYGHGSGKCFKKKPDGSFNFDKDNTVNILTGGKVTSWYEQGQSYFSVFGDLALPFEECRAYAVAYVLCCDTEVLDTLGYEGTSGQSLKYVIWLRYLRDALRSLMGYHTQTGKWLEGHYWARFVLLKVVLEAGQGCLTIKQTKNDLTFVLDQSKIDSVGMPAVRDFLKKLQALKSTADVKGATELFNKYSVGKRELEWNKIRSLKFRGEPSVLLVQHNTVLTEEGGVDLVTYDETPEGVIQSVIDRYTMESVANLEELWKAEKK